MIRTISMKISYTWLCELLPGLDNIPPRELARKLTFAGLEVEEFHDQASRLKGIVVARVVKRDKHPQADRLSVCRVDAGAGEVQVVCGASNVKEGGTYPFATLGTSMPDGLEIKPVKLRGVESSGMLCSARELQLSEESAGLLELPDTLALGAPISDALHLNDTILTLNITPNRGDALGHWGVARDVAALTGLACDFNRVSPDHDTRGLAGSIASQDKPERLAHARVGELDVSIEDPELCTHYTAARLDGVKVGESPEWLKSRLISLGLRPISNVVDATNYVMLLTGHPVHAFDVAKISGAQIIVKSATAATRFKALDGHEYKLQAGDPVIADARGPVALAGVMGGEDSGVTPSTTSLILETARFHPERVRKTSRRLGLVSESSYRFERGINPASVALAARILAALILKLAGGREVARADLKTQNDPIVNIGLQASDIKHLLGFGIPAPEVKRILEALGCMAETRPGGWQVQIPAGRSDLTRPADLVEEVARIHGLDKIPEVMPVKILSPAREGRGGELLPRVRDFFVAQGFHETIHYSFGDETLMCQVLRPAPDAKWVRLKNPLSEDLSTLRPSLLPGLVAAYVHNARLSKKGIRLFECRHTYQMRADGGTSERRVLAGLYAGNPYGRNRFGDGRVSDFFDGKGILETFWHMLRVPVQLERFADWPYHPFQAVQFKVGVDRLAVLGALHPELTQELKITEPVFCFEIDYELLMRVSDGKLPSYKALSPLPPVYRDLALVAPADLSHQEIMTVLMADKPVELVDVEVFDVYAGPPLPEGKKSLAYALKYESRTDTLTDESVNALHFALVEKLTQKLPVQLR